MKRSLIQIAAENSRDTALENTSKCTHSLYKKHIYILCTQTNIDRYHRDKKRKEKKQKNINNS